MRPRTPIPVVLLLCAAQIAGAQSTPPASSATACAAPPAAEPGVNGRTRTLFAVAELGHQAPDTARVYAMFLLDELQRAFTLPTPLGFTAWTEDSTEPDVALPVLAAEAMVVVRADGQVKQVALTQTSLLRSVDTAFEAALRTAAQSEWMPKPSGLRVGEDLTLFIALTFEPTTKWPGTTTLKWLGDSLALARRAVAHPLVRLQLPGARFSARAHAKPSRSASPKYPRHLAAADKGGEVRIEFVVGGNGRAVPGTVRLIGATDRGFADAVFASVNKLRFSPAQIGGCPVPSLVRQAFEFTIRRQ